MVSLKAAGVYTGLLRSISFDHETVVSLAHRFRTEPGFFLLESASSGPGQVARYSFLGFDHLFQAVINGNEISLSYSDENKIETSPEPFDWMGHLIQSCQTELIKDNPKEHCDLDELKNMIGMVGFLSYDASVIMEPSIGRGPGKKIGLPDAVFRFPKNLMIYDHFFRKLHIIAFSHGEKIAESTLQKQLQEVLEKLDESSEIKSNDLKQEPLDFSSFESAVTKEDFLNRVDACLEHVRAGDVFQIQIGNRLSCETKADPFNIFRSLRTLNPSPYMFYFLHEDHHIIGASPEMMVNVENDKIIHRPIAGTRKRSWDSQKDIEICEELVSDEKERAEHIMLVDLSRNDIGRLTESGSVKVDELMIVEKYSHVFHMVSQVSGRLKNQFNAMDAMKYSFPNGTVAGAPKIKAMQLINGFEDMAREFYAGSLGVFSFTGQLKSTILIRTLHYHRGVASTQASAGIVYDSIPENEWMETRNKMAACLTAIQNTKA